MESLRQTALCLHGLCEEDQQWMLGRLPDSSASELRQMLKELESMGIPKDPEFVPDTHAMTSDARDGNQDASSRLARRINRAETDDIACALEAEPDYFIAAVIAAGKWAWQERFLTGLTRERRELVSVLVSKYRVNLPHRLKSSALAALVKRLDTGGVCEGGGKRKGTTLSRLRSVLARGSRRSRA